MYEIECVKCGSINETNEPDTYECQCSKSSLTNMWNVCPKHKHGYTSQGLTITPCPRCNELYNEASHELANIKRCEMLSAKHHDTRFLKSDFVSSDEGLKIQNKGKETRNLIRDLRNMRKEKTLEELKTWLKK